MAEIANSNQTDEDTNKQEASKEKSNTSKVAKKQPNIFELCIDNELENFTNYLNFTKWLHRSVDASALGVFRMLYGCAMLIDIAEERGGSQMDLRFGEAQHCHFPLFNGIQALAFPLMGCVYLCMWLGAIGVTLGYRYRWSCFMYIIPYWYLFLLDKPAWNNHSYLFGLVGTMLCFIEANRYCSLDKLLNPALPSTVPYWNYFIIKFQFFLLYMYAGLKKLTSEWLSGYAMSSLSRHWVLAPFRLILSAELTDLLIVHWFTAIFDFIIAFLMTCRKTRAFASPFMICFHLMNSRLFVIGMFPWVCLAQVPMFFGFDWPRHLGKLNVKKVLNSNFLNKAFKEMLKCIEICKAVQEVEQCTIMEEPKQSEKLESKNLSCKAERKKLQSTEEHISWKQKLRTLFVLSYCTLQMFLPYSHFITQGYNNWTNGLYGYSWDMMVHSYDTIVTTIKIVDNANNKSHYLNPYAFTEYDRWTKYADMAKQYAQCINKNIEMQYNLSPKNSPLKSTNISIYFDIWCSMNGRFQQRVFDPRVDLLQAEWSPWKRTAWSLPLLNELNYMRPKLKVIADEVLAWNNYSDVIFVADFPGLTLENHIPADLTNISLTILEGNVRYRRQGDGEESYFLTSGKTIALESDEKHYITTIGLKPSSYLYTYVNSTMLQANIVIDQNEILPQSKALLPIWQEFLTRLENYRKFLKHIGNCLLYLLYDVPIPMEIRNKNEL